MKREYIVTTKVDRPIKDNFFTLVKNEHEITLTPSGDVYSLFEII